MGVGGSLLGEEGGGLDFGERRLEQLLVSSRRKFVNLAAFFQSQKKLGFFGGGSQEQEQ